MTAWHGGKGSGSRPRQVSNEDYANRWDAIFQRDKPKEIKICPTCSSIGFDVSVKDDKMCSFCDGTEGGQK